MSQGDILSYLKKCKKPKTCAQISKAVGSSCVSVGMSLKILRKHGEVLFKREHKGFLYWSKDNYN